MSTFTLTFKTDNDAFRDEDGNLDLVMLRATVRGVADRLTDQSVTFGTTKQTIRDLYGNRVGAYTIEED